MSGNEIIHPKVPYGYNWQRNVINELSGDENQYFCVMEPLSEKCKMETGRWRWLKNDNEEQELQIGTREAIDLTDQTKYLASSKKGTQSFASGYILQLKHFIPFEFVETCDANSIYVTGTETLWIPIARLLLNVYVEENVKDLKSVSPFWKEQKLKERPTVIWFCERPCQFLEASTRDFSYLGTVAKVPNEE